jgi:hypothetical protein
MIILECDDNISRGKVPALCCSDDTGVGDNPITLIDLAVRLPVSVHSFQSCRK